MHTTFAAELASIRLSALRRLHAIMLATESEAEARRCAIAILKAPALEGIDDVETVPIPAPTPTAPPDLSEPAPPAPETLNTARPAPAPAGEPLPPPPSADDHAHLLKTLTHAVRHLDLGRRSRKPGRPALLLARAGAPPP